MTMTSHGIQFNKNIENIRSSMVVVDAIVWKQVAYTIDRDTHNVEVEFVNPYGVPGSTTPIPQVIILTSLFGEINWTSMPS